MASNPEPIQMPKMPKYQPQVDLNPDDPDQYMMLVPASIAKINTKLPILQMGINQSFCINECFCYEINNY